MRWPLTALVAISLLTLSCALTKASQVPKGGGQTFTSADVERALSDSRKYAREGKYEQALERQIWYHKNALKYDPGQYGVRLSVALGYWVQLGRVYPKALHELRLIRNETLATYRKQTSDDLIFGEVMSIDFALDDLRSAKSLFYEGRKNGNRDDLLLKLNRIVGAGDLKWASDVIGDPTASLEAIKLQRDVSIAALSTRKDLAKDMDDMYARQIANLLRTVAKVKGNAAAHRLQREALKMLDSPEIRNALAAD